MSIDNGRVGGGGDGFGGLHNCVFGVYLWRGGLADSHFGRVVVDVTLGCLQLREGSMGSRRRRLG